jgi:hypothetical protein
MLKKITLITLLLATNSIFCGLFKQTSKLIPAVTIILTTRPDSLVVRLTAQATQCNNTTPPCSYTGQCLCDRLRRQMQAYEISAAMRRIQK